MTDTRTTATLRTANRWQALNSVLLTALIALTIPTTIVSCFALYYGYQAIQGMKEMSEKLKKSNADMEAEIKKANAEIEQERLKQERDLKVRK